MKILGGVLNGLLSLISKWIYGCSLWMNIRDEYLFREGKSH